MTTEQKVRRAVKIAVAVGATFIVFGLFFAILGTPSSEMTGRIVYKGHPVIYGSVILVGADGVAVAGPIEPDGTYRVAAAPVGEVTIGVVSRDPLFQSRASQIKSSREALTAKATTTSPVDRKKWFPLPKDYEEPTSSGLKTTLKKGSNQFDIELP